MKMLLVGLVFLGSMSVYADSIECSVNDGGNFSKLSVDLEGGYRTTTLNIKNGKVSLSYVGKQAPTNLNPFPELTVKLKKQFSTILIPFNRSIEAANGNVLLVEASGRKVTVICLQKEG